MEAEEVAVACDAPFLPGLDLTSWARAAGVVVEAVGHDEHRARLYR